MSFQSVQLHLWWRILALQLLLLGVQSFGLSTDGVLLLSFKYSILSDPLSVLQSWNNQDQTPCSWNGVTCGSPGADSTYSRVTGLSLSNCQLLGSIPANLGMIQHLQNLDLSNNSLNGPLPFSLLSATQLRFLDLSSNMISGYLPETIGRLQNLELLNLSDNYLAGTLPANLTALHNLTAVSLKNNNFTGNLPGGFRTVQVLDLSSNLLNGSLPRDFGGEIPESSLFLNQQTSSFAGNPDLCGQPLRSPCPIPSSAPVQQPLLRAIHQQGRLGQDEGGLKPGTIIGIVIGDVAGVAVLGMVFFYVYHYLKKRRKVEANIKKEATTAKDSWSSSSSESRGFTRWACLRKRGENEEDSESTSTGKEAEILDHSQRRTGHHEQNREGTLVTVDGEKELEIETLLKASAYILGATGSSIMYKAVLEDGTSFAVRRIGENHVERFRDFETQVRAIAKLVHPNLVRIRGFYWGVDEKLIIYDFVPNGCLANARYRKAGSSPCHLPWESRLRIAKGVARGLSFLHDKKHVHGNLKPSNILLGSDMEPRIGDFGLEKLVIEYTSCKVGESARNFGSNRSNASRDSFQDFGTGPSPSPSPSSIGGLSLYHAPESLRSLKPNPKWDVYSFGVILLELLTGKVVVVDELGQGSNGLAVEDKNRALRMADVAIRADVEGKEDALLACFKLGYSCASPVPQKRPTMKEALQVIEKLPSPSASYPYGH
ncbi:LRR RECEPTOR-LIKE SERINE/THREONINE-PROTEIN KINASE-RELATED [Salix koriyanagi]|uniref:LRR RECEPTOR-LIKE SERINE/THREONINE-PROTEIN KINASE-RELATED n=1 Tax=Salix koriyanagi TaxID=2511006 RepID=A0A9Q0UNE5_9ROSI|nr:LRR RECEPTOR-LIKE SERINE/THREONINE-PROTEIN KINASE-RELATED [Salix koriyanagi]